MPGPLQSLYRMFATNWGACIYSLKSILHKLQNIAQNLGKPATHFGDKRTRTPLFGAAVLWMTWKQYKQGKTPRRVIEFSTEKVVQFQHGITKYAAWDEQMNAINQKELKPFACKYIWWKNPEEAVRTPERVIAQVMNIGDYNDVQLLYKQLGDEVLRKVLRNAEAGQFNERSWAYWHFRLGLSSSAEPAPKMPTRKFS